MAKKVSSYRLGRRLKASAKARRDFITYINSDGQPKSASGRGSDDLIVTMLYSQESQSGFIGYSSFQDDAFGELQGPEPIAANPLLAFMKLPGGGDYAVFEGNAVTRLSTADITLGEVTAAGGDANTLSYSAGTGRTTVLYTEDTFVIEPEVQYPVAVKGLPIIVIPPATVELGGAVAVAKLTLRHNLRAVNGLGGGARVNIFPPVTIRPAFDLGGGMSAPSLKRVTQYLGAVFDGGDISMGADLMPFTRRLLAGAMELGGAASADVETRAPVLMRAVAELGGTAIARVAPPAVPEFVGMGTPQLVTGFGPTVAAPASKAVGDLLLLLVYGAGNATIPTPSGWAEYPGGGNSGFGAVKAFTRTATAGADSAALGYSGPGAHFGVIMAYRKAQVTNAIAGYNQNSGSNSAGYGGNFNAQQKGDLLVSLFASSGADLTTIEASANGNIDTQVKQYEGFENPTNISLFTAKASVTITANPINITFSPPNDSRVAIGALIRYKA